MSITKLYKQLATIYIFAIITSLLNLNKLWVFIKLFFIKIKMNYVVYQITKFNLLSIFQKNFIDIKKRISHIGDSIYCKFYDNEIYIAIKI